MIDQLLSLRLIAEKYQDYDKDLYICYVDFQKAFDSVLEDGSVVNDEASLVQVRL